MTALLIQKSWGKNYLFMKKGIPKKESIKIIFSICLIFVLLGLVSAQQIVGSMGGNIQTSRPTFSADFGLNPVEYLNDFGQDTCQNRKDFIVTIPLGGCTPTVVRSDLLEEQKVPVFCKLSAIQINPLMDVSRIRGIKFAGPKPEGILDYRYYPARNYLKNNNIEGTRVVDNIGYLVIILAQNPVEADMPDFLNATLTAVIEYDIDNAFGIGKHEFYSRPLDDVEWEREYLDHGFWNGKGYVRVEDVQEDSARISIYQNQVDKFQTVNLKEGEISEGISLDGYYCSAGMNIELTDIGYPVDKALILVDEEEFWVSKGSKFLDDKCRVLDIQEVKEGNGQISVHCSGAGNFDLKLGVRKANLNVSGKIGEYEVGEKVKSLKNSSLYLTYVGEDDDGDFVILVKSKLDESSFRESGIIEGTLDQIEVIKRTEDGGKLKINTDIIFEDDVVADILEEGDEDYEGITFVSVLSGKEILAKNPLMKSYYENATMNYEEVFEFYSHETKKNLDLLEPYGAMALKNAADLSGILGLRERQEDYLNKLIQNYPELGISRRAEQDLDNLRHGQISEESSAVVYIDQIPSFISLLKIKTPDFDELGAELSIDGKRDDFELNEINLDENTKLIEIMEDSVTVEVYARTTETNPKTERRTIGLGKTEKVNDLLIRVNKINFNREATVKLIPFNRGTRSEVDFEFGVGIEKRAIELSPERTLKMIESLTEQIQEWNEINERLGKVVKGLKGACFATSAMLTVKNFFGGLSGESLARNKVMTSQGGWNEQCKKLKARGDYGSVSSCLLDKNSEVEASVKAYQEQIASENDELKKIQSGLEKKDDGLFESSYDIGEVEEGYRTRFREVYNANKGIEYRLRDGTPKKLGDVILEDDIKELSIEDMKEIVTSIEVARDNRDDDVLLTMMHADLGDKLYSLDQRLAIGREYSQLSGAGKSLGITAIAPSTNKPQQVAMSSVSGTKAKGLLGSDSTEAFIVHIPFGTGAGLTDETDTYNLRKIAGKDVLVGLKKGTSDEYDLKNAVVIKKEGDDWIRDESVTIDVKQAVGQYYDAPSFTKADHTLYNNQIIDDKIVQYHQTSPYVGFPALVPFDMRNGWYVATDYIISGGGQPFEDSGRAMNFWICNVGPNGLIDFKQGDDCRYYNRGTGQSSEMFGLTIKQSNDLVDRAENALKQARKKYKSGIQKVVINGIEFETGIAENSNAGQCSDFMSPKDCWLMFNVCDPVLCPASRCDFGGQYRVANVVQSGIVGSLLLCLPNFPEVMVPVCLTGIHAGIESYTSILNSTVRCLNESLETGRNIGICDEVKSIYLCEFFWKQAVPLMDVIIPKMFEMALGQGARGGGEYLTVQSAWENTQKSVEYFNNEYAVNSMQAFNIRSTEGAGSEVCKGFISGRYPNSADFMDNLVEPDSPSQFTGWFSENQLTTATVPPLSHYKVYYHIYAGRDTGVQYIVYLSSPTDPSIAQSASSIVVDRGYIEQGGQVDEAKDMEAVSGYTELCIEVNGQIECGFGQASTSFLANTLADNYVNNQASEKDITNSNDCVGGTSNTGTLFNSPNLQANIEEGINPEIYKRGIIRVCSSKNPGAGVEDLVGGVVDSGNQRWKEVGYCDDEEIKCWIDTEGIKDVLNRNKQLLDETLSNIDEPSLAEYLESYDLKDKDSKSFLEDAEKVVEESKGDIDIAKIKTILSNLNNVSETGSKGYYRAEAFFLKARIYDALTKQEFAKISVFTDGKKPKLIEGDKPKVVAPKVDEKPKDVEGDDEIPDETPATETPATETSAQDVVAEDTPSVDEGSDEPVGPTLENLCADKGNSKETAFVFLLDFIVDEGTCVKYRLDKELEFYFESGDIVGWWTFDKARFFKENGVWQIEHKGDSVSLEDFKLPSISNEDIEDAVDWVIDYLNPPRIAPEINLA